MDAEWPKKRGPLCLAPERVVNCFTSKAETWTERLQGNMNNIKPPRDNKKWSLATVEEKWIPILTIPAPCYVSNSYDLRNEEWGVSFYWNIKKTQDINLVLMQLQPWDMGVGVGGEWITFLQGREGIFHPGELLYRRSSWFFYSCFWPDYLK